MALQRALSLFDELKAEWLKKPDPTALKNCENLLSQLKICLTSVSFLPSGPAKATVQELVIARDALEIGALVSIHNKDIPSFERYIAQLKAYYTDHGVSIPRSPYEHELLGLNLLCLLAQNKLEQFHTELELLDPTTLQNNVYLRHPISLERYLMEGSYNKIFLSRGNVPSETYNFFIDILVDTVREEIAACIEKSYTTVGRAEAVKMLFLSSVEDLGQIATKRAWCLGENDAFFFHQETKHERMTPSVQLISQTLEYAKELERIV
ncbi:26S proteasome non-ATPase regulatory subunit 8-like [Oscarella lobularis]|uniref:26S proteasome non-ATPase regulatory subunit 8-like n=1 Tax=Oscarella lobularis TaxID=121494 RepID=UPI003313D2AF